MIQCFILEPNHIHYTVYCAVVMLGVVASLYTAVVLNCQDAAYFSSVVFLCITMVHIGDENPYIFVLNRVTETLIGVIVGVAVNAFHLPRRKRKDVLFVTALDDVLISGNTRSAFEALQAGGDSERYKIVCGESEDYPDCCL